MQGSATQFLAICCLGFLLPSATTLALAEDLRRIALKHGESVELYSVYYTTNCRSILTGKPEVEVLEGPPEVTLTVREGMVLPRKQGCAKTVLGGTLVAMAT